MRRHGAAVAALIAPLGRPVYFRSTSDPAPLNPPAAGVVAYPYYLVWPSVSAPGPDETVSGSNAHISAIFGVTAVAETPGAAAVAARNAQALLGASGLVDLPLAGRSGSIRWSHFGTIDEDMQVTLASGGHPTIDVEFYRVESTPT